MRGRGLLQAAKRAANGSADATDPHAGDAPAPIPKHVAIIMDGNGRWAKRRNLPRTAGHQRGVEAVRRTVRHAGTRGVEVLTLFAFSRENWSRPASEVSELLGLLRRYIRSDLEELLSAGVRLSMIGAREGLDPDLLAMITEGEERSAGNTKMQLVLAFNYGGRDEIVRAAKAMAREAAAGTLDIDSVNEADFAGFLDTGRLPDPDLVIRTSGEQRVSNFLLWQSAYAEYVFPETLWPDFDAAMFDEALADYARRERRFGAVSPPSARSTA